MPRALHLWTSSMHVPRVCAVHVTVAILSLLASPAVHAQTASARETTMVFRTYPFGDPDPVARVTNIYPYFRFDGYSVTGRDSLWRVVVLENRYLRILIAPAMGGKVLGAFERSSGEAFIYFNNVIKFREIAMRGPWTSGGLEFNFGDIGHAPTTATPVDYILCTNSDGSASCFIGALDLPSRTEWRVEIRLPGDAAYFETRSDWYNPTDANTSLYHWMNAAADAGDDLHFDYPGTAYIGHGGELFPWPLDSLGRYLAEYRNNNFGSYKSYHVLGSRTEFFGAHWADRNRGVIHWAPFADKPGKKLWIWGLSRQGEIWRDLLTDPELGNPQYVEIQSGLLFNQAAGSSSQTPFKHMFFEPFSHQRFTEAWFPWRGIGGVVEANLNGALNVERFESTLKVGLCPVVAMDDTIVVKQDNRILRSLPVNLRPLDSIIDSIILSGEGPIEVSVGSCLRYSSLDDTMDRLQRPLLANPSFDWRSLYGIYTGALEYARQRSNTQALEGFLSCLKIDPTFSPALLGAAECNYRRGDFHEALRQILAALANDAYDADANFLYGLVSRRMGRYGDAEDGFGFAARSSKYASGASVELAEIALLRGDGEDALHRAHRALDHDRYSLRARYACAVAERAMGHREDAGRWTEEILLLDPLNHVARFERYLADSTKDRKQECTSLIRNELPHESFLEAASYYRGIGRLQDARGVLELAPQNPMVDYWLASLNDGLGDSSAASRYLDRAVAASPFLVFPHRFETSEILRWASETSPSWKTTYYRALSEWSCGRVDSAAKLFGECGTMPDWWPFYLARGNFFAGGSTSQAESDYRIALQLGSDNWRPYRTLTRWLNDRGRHEEALKVIGAAASRFPSSYVVLFDLATTQLYCGQHKASLSILDTLTVLPFEGASYGREAFRQANVLYAADLLKQRDYAKAIQLLLSAREWPERLGVGRPYDVDNRLEEYMEAICYRRLGNHERADSLLRDVAAFTRANPGNKSVNIVFGALAMGQIGAAKEGRTLVRQWVESAPDGPVVRWVSAVVRNDRNRAGAEEKAIRGEGTGSLLHRSTVPADVALAVEVISAVE